MKYDNDDNSNDKSRELRNVSKYCWKTGDA